MNGCHNRPQLKESTWVQDGWEEMAGSRIPRMVGVPFRMSKDCEYRKTALGQSDKGCDGCKHRQPAE